MWINEYTQHGSKRNINRKEYINFFGSAKLYLGSFVLENSTEKTSVFADGELILTDNDIIYYPYPNSISIQNSIKPFNIPILEIKSSHSENTHSNYRRIITKKGEFLFEIKNDRAFINNLGFRRDVLFIGGRI